MLKLRLFLYIGLCLIIGSGLLASSDNVAPPAALAQDTATVSYSRPVQGNISDENPQQNWRFEGRSGDRLTILVNTKNGTLDPTVTLLDPSGTVLASNDDRIPSIVLDAGIERIELTENGSYTIQISRYSGTGDYQLHVLPASFMEIRENTDFSGNTSRWTNVYARPENERLTLSANAGFEISSFLENSSALTDFYLQAEFTWLSDRSDVEASLGFIIRAQENGTRRPPGYYFLVTPDGTWTVLLRQNDEFSVLQPPTPSALLSDTLITLSVEAENNRLRFFASGELLGEIIDTTFTEGTWGFHVQGAVQPTIISVDNLLLTVTADEKEPLPLTIESWENAYSGDIVDELEAEGVIQNKGERVLNIIGQSYGVGRLQQNVFLQGIDTEVYTDFVMGVDVVFSEGDNIGCGMIVRYQDQGNQTIGYVDSSGGVGLVHVQDGIIQRNTYDLLDIVSESLENDNLLRLIIVAQVDRVTLYMNGEWFSTEFMPPTGGRVGVTLLNYSTTGASCIFNNIWVWE